MTEAEHGNVAAPDPDTGFLARGGEMGRLIRAHDWSATPVGPPGTWPQTLRTTIRLMLTSRHPMFVWWGEALTCFYNDAYSAAIGPDRHPSALGRPGREVWAEIWDAIGPDIEFVMSGQGATWHERQLIPITRGGTREDVWWTYGYSPIDDDDAASGVGGVLVICRDVSAEVQAGQAKSNEAGRLRAFFEQAPGFMALLRGPDHVYELANAAYVSLVNREVLGSTVREALPEIREQGFFELLDQVYATGEVSIARRAPITLASGPNGASNQHFLDFIYQPVRNAAGAVNGIFVQGSDVTEATLAEADLRASEARQAFLLALGDALSDLADPRDIMQAVAGLLGRHLSADRVGYAEIEGNGEFFTATRDWCVPAMPSLAGRHRLDDFGPALIAEFRAGHSVAIEDVLAGPLTPGEDVARAYHEAGTRAAITVPLVKAGRFAAALYVHAREPRRWTAGEETLVREVAERTWAAVGRARAEAELRDSEQRLRLALGAGGLGDYEWDMRADAVRPSVRAREIFGFGPGEGERPADYLARMVPEDVARAQAALEAGLAAGRVASGYRIRLPDGAVRHILSHGHVVRGADGAPARLIGMFADETERKHLEHELLHLNQALELRVAERTAELMGVQAALQQSQKMEAVGQLTGGIAHDFNNMLQAIGSSLELMQRRVEQGRTAEAARFVNSARATVARAAALTHQLLAFARRQTLQPKPVVADTLMRGMEALLRQTAGPGVTVEMHMHDGTWPVLCDPNQLESVLLNLVINARDAMPDGGRLMVTTRHVRLSAADIADQDGADRDGAAPGDFVEVAVADTGTGMDEATRARAFEPFFTTKPIGQGTGLGLSQLHGFVRQSGGVVQLDSAPGQGTTVRVLMPRHNHAIGEEEPPAPGMELPKAGAGQTVLLVEDEAEVRAIAAEHLRDLGYAVLEAGDGPAALRLLGSGRQVSLLVTDVGLPGGMNGRQVADAARERLPGLPALFITGYAGTVLQEQLAAGMEVIGKPFPLDALVTRMRAMLDAATTRSGPEPA